MPRAPCWPQRWFSSLPHPSKFQKHRGSHISSRRPKQKSLPANQEGLKKRHGDGEKRGRGERVDFFPASPSPRITASICSKFGGGGGSRTRVRKPSARSIYVHSRCFKSRSLRLPAAGFGRSQLIEFRFPLISIGGNLSRCVDAPVRPYGRQPAERLLAMQ